MTILRGPALLCSMCQLVIWCVFVQCGFTVLEGWMVVVLCGVLINGVGLVVSLDYRKTGCVDGGAGGVIWLVLCTILYAVVTYTLYTCACVSNSVIHMRMYCNIIMDIFLSNFLYRDVTVAVFIYKEKCPPLIKHYIFPLWFLL